MSNEADEGKSMDEARADAEASAADPLAEKKPAASGKAKARPARRPVVTTMQWVFLAVVAITAAGLDLWSKSWAVRHLSTTNFRSVPLCTPPPGGQHYLYQRLPTREVTLARNYLDLRYAENCGGAWGLLHGTREGLRRPFFLVVAVAAVLFIIHLYRSLEAGQRMMRWALPLVLGGAIGNLVDRLRLGYVVDFIDMHWRERYHWPTYNIADIAITVGIALMLLEYILGPRKAPTKNPKPAPSSS
jgi:signal peptidase II